MADVSAVEETFRRLGATKGVVGVLVLNGDSIPIRSTMDNSLSVHYAGLASCVGRVKGCLSDPQLEVRLRCSWHPQVAPLVTKSRRAVQKLGVAPVDDELLSIRLRSKKHEVIIAPEFASGHDYTLVVVQDPCVE